MPFGRTIDVSGGGHFQTTVTGIPPKNLVVVGAVATVGTLTLVLVLTGVIPLLPAPTHPAACTALECGMVFTVGNPVPGTCPSGGTWLTRGCLGGDFVYTITIYHSAAKFGQVFFHIYNQNNTVYVAKGGAPGFLILNSTGSVSASYDPVDGAMNMTSGWMYASGTSASTFLGNNYSILVEMGSANPHGLLCSFVVTVTGSSSGTTGPLTLP